MKALALLHMNEMSMLDIVYDALQDNQIELCGITFKEPFQGECVQSGEILESIQQSEVVVYFASKNNLNNHCLDLALREAARINKKVICISLEEETNPGSGFEQYGDCLIASISELPKAIIDDPKEWNRPDGSLREDRPFKRYKCGAKE